MALDWDILDFDCDSLVGWADTDTGTGVSTQETFDSKSTFKLSCPTTDTSSASRWQTSISVPDSFTAEWSCYLADTNGFGLTLDFWTTSGHYYIVVCYNHTAALYFSPTNPLWMNSFLIPWTGASPPLGYEDSALLDRWNTYRLVVKADRKADLWVNNRCYIADVTCSVTSATTEAVGMRYVSSSAATGAALAYVDYIKVDTTPEGLTNVSAMNISGTSLTINTSHETSWEYTGAAHSFVTVPKLRIYHSDAVGNSAVCGLPIIDNTATNASAVRIYDGSVAKAIQSLPT